MYAQIDPAGLKHRPSGFFGRVIDQCSDAGRVRLHRPANLFDSPTQKELCGWAAADVASANGKDPLEHLSSPSCWRNTDFKADLVTRTHSVATFSRVDQGTAHTATIDSSAATGHAL